MRRPVLLYKDTNISEEPVASIVSSGGAGHGLLLRVGTYLLADRNFVNQNQISCATFKSLPNLVVSHSVALRVLHCDRQLDGQNVVWRHSVCTVWSSARNIMHIFNLMPEHDTCHGSVVAFEYCFHRELTCNYVFPVQCNLIFFHRRATNCRSLNGFTLKMFLAHLKLLS
jgi:hypothetical protein